METGQARVLSPQIQEQQKGENMSNTVTVNREHKDRLFISLFGSAERKENTLELYNAVNGTHYDNPEDITIYTIEDAL